ncbi:hypothetical protein C8A05DRAFT_39235 [Staphylotrichum tortipilum]|uniref:Copper acquisition factor BIM1-like domain-containing protein n=1 Tax=Staphylotrichum tortipilum TaxID=2831512 RepID=A0AAN6RPB4_9PEZI|nr:hypothetical protein C8A05DRAFT_39235 [Staphylotrichum longicolle]
MALPTLLLLASASLTSAHFGIEYPPMRANTLGSSKNSSYSQWTNPCAGVPGNLTDRPITPWPLSGGGSLKLDLHHHWTYLFINLGLGPDVSNFNYTLTNPFWNETGNGTLCIPKLAVPADLPVTEGTQGSLQVVTVGDDGNALYNCADIVFRANATALGGDDCKSSPGVSYTEVGAAKVDTGNGSAAGGSGSGSGSKSAGAGSGVNLVALSSTVALAMVFVLGMSV